MALVPESGEPSSKILRLPVDMAVFNDPPKGKQPRLRLGYGTANRARRSIKLLKKQPLPYQTQAAHTLYARAKYHKYQTEGMKEAMKLYGRFLKALRSRSPIRKRSTQKSKGKPRTNK